jgi:hypothetical protein
MRESSAREPSMASFAGPMGPTVREGSVMEPVGFKKHTAGR